MAPRPRTALIGSAPAQRWTEGESLPRAGEDSVGMWESSFSPSFDLLLHQDGVCGGEDAHQLVHLPALQVPEGEQKASPWLQAGLGRGPSQ